MRNIHILLILSTFLLAIVIISPLPAAWENILLGVAIEILGAIIIFVIVTVSPPYRLVLIGWLYPNKKLRVSMAALLRVEIRGQYILNELERRPGTFGPLGGVYKYFQSATAFLESIDFRQDYEGFEDDPNMERDFRGFVPAKHGSRFLKWFQESSDRERDVIDREIREELLIGGIIDTNSSLLSLQTRHVRTVYEGPYRVKGYPHLQFRQFDIFEPANLKDAQERELLEIVDSPPPSIKIVSAAEIEANMTKDHHVIGDHTEFLLGKTLISGKRR